ncbi:hypothetical protein KIPB_008701, partial [Kipferlia bialata]|eukprot:g8701.t1
MFSSKGVEDELTEPEEGQNLYFMAEPLTRTPPPEREGHSMAYIEDTSDSCLADESDCDHMCLIYGGLSLSDLWEMHVYKTKELDDDNIEYTPTPYFAKATTLGDAPDITGYSCGWSSGGDFYMFAGLTDSGATDSMYVYSPEQTMWSQVAVPTSADEEWPGPRYRQSCQAYTDPEDGRAYALVYGGRGTTGFLDELWRYDIEANTWHEIATTNTPDAREAASLGVLVVPKHTDLDDNEMSHVWAMIYSGRAGSTSSAELDPVDTHVIDVCSRHLDNDSGSF